MFQDQRKIYDREQDMIRKLREWILTAVPRNYTETCCDPVDDLRTWYKNLKQSAGLDESLARDMVQRKYQAAVKPLKRQPEDLEAWITAWEQAIESARKKELPAVARPEDWLREFLNALAPIKATWVESFRMLNRRNVIAGILTYRDVANELRTAVRDETRHKGINFEAGFHSAVVDQSSHQSQTNNSTAITEASFGVAKAAGLTGPIFDGGDDQHAQGDAPGDAHARPGGGLGRGTLKRRNTDVIATVCKGCGLPGHLYDNCLYLFPEKAPKDFKPHRELQAYVKVILEDNLPLAEEVARRRAKEKSQSIESE
jgi:hypothetical protein